MPATLPRVAPDIGPILSLVRKTRLLLRSSWATVGAGLTVGLAFLALAIVTMADLAVPLVGPWVRLTGLVLFVVPTVAVFVWKGVLPLSRRLRNVEIARRIESKIPGMHSRLVSCMDLAGREQEVSPAFYRKLRNESLDRIGKYRATAVVDFRALRQALVAAAVGVGLFALLWAALGARLTTALNRVFHPFADLPPASDVALSAEPGTTKILSGEDVTFVAHVTYTSHRTHEDPDDLMVELTGDNATVRYPLEKVPDGTWRRTLRGLSAEKGFEKGFTYRVFGGRTWTRLNRIDWAERPVVLETAVRVRFPEYMAIPDPRPNPPKERDVIGPVGSQVEVMVEVEGEVAAGDIQLLEARVKRTPNRDRRERVWFDNALPAGAQPAGEWKWEESSAVRGKAHFHPAAGGTGFHGFAGATTPFVVNAGEVLFAHVYLDPANPPETVMLQWATDSGEAEHRAYWGANRIEQGNAGTPARHFMGPIPREWLGQWKLVEVPAAAVGLEGKKLRGMTFLQFGGSAKFAAAGASLPSFLEEREYHVAGTYPLSPAGDRTWSGTFPLIGSGQYRVELRNELGHANKPASENPRYEAVADQPPMVSLDRPGTDLVLSKPDKVPLQIAARDDYGLLDLWLAVQKDGELKFTRAVKIKEYATPNPLKADTIVASLDLTAGGFNFKAGDTLRYRVEVRDRRPNAEAVVSKDFAVRIAEDANAADKLLDQFEKGQDTFRDRLVNLIAEQKKVKEKIDQVQAKYDALNTQVQAAVEEAKAKAKPKDGQPPKDVPPPAIDPKDAQAMADLRKELNDLFGQEQKNVAAATALDQELKTLAANAQKASLLNGEINRQMQDVAGQFKGAALDPLQDLASRLQQGANPAATPPDLKDTKARSDRVQKNLESLKGRMDAVADAQKGMKSDVEKALAKLKEDLLKEQGKMTARDLEELKEFLKNLRDELGKWQGKQEDLADKTDKAPEKDIPELEGKQKTLDELLKKDLDLAKKILDREKARRMRKPDFPDEPFAGDPKERKTAPKEEDTPPDADPAKKGDKTDTTAKPEKKTGTDDEEDLFKPALKGEREKLDPRFAKKMRPNPKKGDKREELEDHQQDNLRDLDVAQKGLKSDEQSLEEMIQSLMNASQKGQPNSQKDPSGKSPADQLMDMLRSEAMKAAMQMAQRAKQGKNGQPQSGPPQPPTGTASDSLMGNSIGAAGMLDELDPRTRATILQLPPRVREELLQGMKTQGPEGYQKFIQDYFRRLSAVPK
jgi:hypothetical protein